MRNGSISAEGLGGHGSPTVYRSGRVCAHDGCEARLSIYNSAECCALHDMSAMASRPPRGLTRRRRRADGVSRAA
jgi:hypothetical protein